MVVMASVARRFGASAKITRTRRAPLCAVRLACPLASQRCAFAPPMRSFSSGRGGGDKNDDDIAALAASTALKINLDCMPTSWTAPESVFEFAQGHLDDDDVDEAIIELAERNEEWREKMLNEDASYFTELGSGQSPKFFWIGCSDSRVAVENMVCADPGEMFVHRNVANMVVATDANLRAALQYAVDYLKVEHIVVCGHYDCGGLKAAVTNKDHSAPLEQWLSHIRDVYRLHAEELEQYDIEEEKHKRFVELNVREQCLNLFKTAEVQRRRVYTAQRPAQFGRSYPRIHAMVFSPSDGVLRRLPVDFKAHLSELDKIYNMYQVDVRLDSMRVPEAGK